MSAKMLQPAQTCFSLLLYFTQIILISGQVDPDLLQNANDFLSAVIEDVYSTVNQESMTLKQWNENFQNEFDYINELEIFQDFSNNYVLCEHHQSIENLTKCVEWGDQYSNYQKRHEIKWAICFLNSYNQIQIYYDAINEKMNGKLKLLQDFDHLLPQCQNNYCIHNIIGTVDRLQFNLLEGIFRRGDAYISMIEHIWEDTMACYETGFLKLLQDT
ncbi:uncharacterized protein LOC126265923 [Aethina tumida]|uniref:uncharacterized protein LOC126265923 n=1 Tax=Aethina tumida TaxID=116153 RepID=UPI00214850A6|nr:uncharacterized protein LOC126265923 [Aethina tumida]